jgi:6-phosphogluconolactonase
MIDPQFGRLHVVPGAVELAQAGAAFFIRAGETAISTHGYFTVALSGGSTPKAMYELLVQSGLGGTLDGARIHVFFGDERLVPSDDHESNYHMANQAMLAALPIPKHQVHRIRTELGDPQEIARQYEQDLKKTFLRLDPKTGRWPRFDLVILGLGENGHTASLFSDGVVSGQSGDEWVIAPWVPSLDDYRISLTASVFNEAAEILFLVGGEKKASMLHQVLDKSTHGTRKEYPVQRIQPRRGQLTWLVDQAAAAKLTQERAA